MCVRKTEREREREREREGGREGEREREKKEREGVYVYLCTVNLIECVYFTYISCFLSLLFIFLTTATSL